MKNQKILLVLLIVLVIFYYMNNKQEKFSAGEAMKDLTNEITPYINNLTLDNQKSALLLLLSGLELICLNINDSNLIEEITKLRNNINSNINNITSVNPILVVIQMIGININNSKLNEQITNLKSNITPYINNPTPANQKYVFESLLANLQMIVPYI